MRAGKLRHKIEIKNLGTSVPGDRGQETGDYVTVRRPWAEVTFGDGNETDVARQRVSQESVQVRLRYTPVLTAASRIVYKGRTLSVVKIDNKEGRNRELIVTCTDQK